MGMKLTRRTEGGPALSLVPLIDVMLILLVFFMVTSTYLDLDMIPKVDQAEAPLTGAGPAAETQQMLLLCKSLSKEFPLNVNGYVN